MSTHDSPKAIAKNSSGSSEVRSLAALVAAAPLEQVGRPLLVGVACGLEPGLELVAVRLVTIGEVDGLAAREGEAVVCVVGEGLLVQAAVALPDLQAGAGGGVWC